jgi:hypothetical protein
MEKEYKTPSYIRKAQKDYRERTKEVRFRISSDEFTRAAAVGLDSQAVKALFLAEIEKREKTGAV